MNWKFGDVLTSVGDRMGEYGIFIMFVGAEEATDTFIGFALMDDDDETAWTGRIMAFAVEDWELHGS